MKRESKVAAMSLPDDPTVRRNRHSEITHRMPHTCACRESASEKSANWHPHAPNLQACFLPDVCVVPVSIYVCVCVCALRVCMYVCAYVAPTTTLSTLYILDSLYSSSSIFAEQQSVGKHWTIAITSTGRDNHLNEG